jgi:hypothetical protein
MQEWGSHKIALRNPPTKGMCDVHKLHITQSVCQIGRSWTSGDRNTRTTVQQLLTEIVTVSGGHVLRETTSRGRCELVCPFDSPLPEDHRVNTLSTTDSLRHH